MGNLNADLSGVSDDDMNSSGGWHVKPDGWYRMYVSEAEPKPTSAGTGTCVHTKLMFLDPQYQGQYQMIFVNVRNPSEKAQMIGQAQLKALAIAIDHPNPDLIADTSELINKPLYVKLGSEVAEAGREQYADANGLVQKVLGFCSEAEHVGADDQTPPPPAPEPKSVPIVDDIPF